jgi:hypothetical protein
MKDGALDKGIIDFVTQWVMQYRQWCGKSSTLRADKSTLTRRWTIKVEENCRTWYVRIHVY